MNFNFALPVLLVLAGCASAPLAGELASSSAQISAKPVTAEVLDGTWDVALYFSADSPPSATEMQFKTEGSKIVSGSFYQSEFQKADLSIRNGVLAFAFVTTDGLAPYNTSGRYIDGRIEGQTHSLGRDFLMIWTATRRTDGPDVTA